MAGLLYRVVRVVFSFSLTRYTRDVFWGEWVGSSEEGMRYHEGVADDLGRTGS